MSNEFKLENAYLDKGLIHNTDQSVGFTLKIEARIEKNDIKCYIENADDDYCRYVKVEKDKIIGANIDDINDEFRDIYYQLIYYLFQNETRDIFNLYVKKDNGIVEVLEIEKDYIYSNKKEFYQIMTCVLERNSKFLRVFIIVRDFSKEIDAISEINKVLEIKNYNDKIMNISGVVSNLAHSWRQPLNSLNFSIINLIDEIDNNTGDNKLVREYYSEVWQILKSLSCKVEKFKTFFEMDYEKKHFNVSKYLNLVFEIMEEKIKKENIKINVNIEDDLDKYGSPNEFVQIMYCVFFDIIECCNMILDTYDRILSIDVNNDETHMIIDIKIIFNREKYGDFKLALKHMSVFNNIIHEHMNGSIDLINNKVENKVKISFLLDR